VTASLDIRDDDAASRVAEVVLLIISMSSLMAVALLCAEIFTPLRALAGGVFFSSILLIFRPRLAAETPKPKNKKEILLIASLLALAFFFRSDPYLWIGGGQDQGTYVNMASHLGAAGSPFFHDELRASLSDELKLRYDANNVVMQTNRVNYEKGKREGVYLPGMYVADLTESRYVFQFYPVHPIWMAMFENFFGESRKVFSLPFFGLLSIFFFYMILRQLTRHAVFSFFGASLLCLNPLHAFFSKFPVAEIPYLAFSLGGLFFLLRGLAPQISDRGRSYFLILSVLSFSAMFFTRISGFMLLPTMMLGMIFNETFTEKGALRVFVRSYFLALAISFALSVLYGLHYSFPYTSDIFHFVVKPVVGEASTFVVLAVMLALALTVGVSLGRGNLAYQRFQQGMEHLLHFALGVVPIIVLGTIIFSSYLIYQLAFTDAFSSTRLDTKWGASELGLESVRHWSLLVLLSHLSPGVTLFLLFFSRGVWRKAPMTTQFLGLSTAGFFIYVALIKWFVPYQYYFARYQLSELLPLALLVSLLLFWLVINGKFGKVKKGVAYLLMLSSVPYSLMITAGQLGVREQHGLLETIKKIETEAGYESVVLIDSLHLNLPYAGDLKTSLTFHSSLKVMTVSAESEALFSEHFCKNNTRISRLGKIASPDSVKIEVVSPLYKRRPSALLEAHENPSSTLYLDKINCDLVRLNRVKESGYLYIEREPKFGTVTGFYPDSDWTREQATFTFPRPVQLGERIEIETFGWAPIRQKTLVGFMVAQADQHLLKCELIDSQHFECDSSDLYKMGQLTLTFQTWRPIDFAINNDENVYGLDIRSIRIR